MSRTSAIAAFLLAACASAPANESIGGARPTYLDAITAQLSQLGDVTVERGRGIVALVGAGLGESTPTMARALSALGELRLHMCSLSATGINLTLITDDDQVDEAARRLHAEFFEAAA